jgi:cbb3-type cytochrome oxidase subunit 3
MFQKTENVFAFLFSLFFVSIVYFMINLVDPKYRTHISQGNSCGTCYTCLVFYGYRTVFLREGT